MRSGRTSQEGDTLSADGGIRNVRSPARWSVGPSYRQSRTARSRLKI